MQTEVARNQGMFAELVLYLAPVSLSYTRAPTWNVLFPELVVATRPVTHLLVASQRFRHLADLPHESQWAMHNHPI